MIEIIPRSVAHPADRRVLRLKRGRHAALQAARIPTHNSMMERTERFTLSTKYCKRFRLALCYVLDVLRNEA